MRFELTSTAFAQGASIPIAYTCDGPNRSPALRWGGAPTGTQSFALIMDFRLRALPDESLTLREGASRTDVDRAIGGRALGTAQLMGRYNR